MIREICLIYKIWKWHNKTFPALSLSEQKGKFNSEVNEYLSAKKAYNKSPYVRKPKYSPAVMEETADVIIAGLNLLKYPEIFERVAIKHSENTQRTWNGVQHNGD